MSMYMKWRKTNMISIILPIYNMQDYISECLESVLNQTYKDLEIICVNDFSMDNSMTIVKNYAKNDKRIKIVNNEKNRGLGGARNVGLDAATGEYIIFCDTDDKMMPNMAEKLYRCIVESDADMAFCDVMLLSSDELLTPYKPFHDMTISANRIFYPQKAFYRFCDMWPSAWNKIYKKSIIDTNRIRCHENILYEDHTFYYEYLLASEKVAYIPEPLYIYRNERNDSIMKEVSPRIFEIFTILDYIKEIFKNNLEVKWYKILMPKIATRLIWERTLNFGKTNKLTKNFHNQANKYLSQFKQKDVFRYKDFFIDDNGDFLYSPFQRFMQKIFSIKYYRDHNVIFVCGIKFKKRSSLRELYIKMDIIQQQIIYLNGELNNANK